MVGRATRLASAASEHDVEARLQGNTTSMRDLRDSAESRGSGQIRGADQEQWPAGVEISSPAAPPLLMLQYRTTWGGIASSNWAVQLEPCRVQ